jgi:phytol kinase
MFSEIASHDPYLVGLSFLWIALVIAVGELIRRCGRQPPDLTRKLIHVGVGFWALPTALLFQSFWWAAFCPLVFVGLNALSYRFRLMEVIEEEGRGTPGTIYFPLSFALLILAFWPLGSRAASVAGLFAMGFGDAAASIVGRRWGRHRYRVGEAAKSLEGTAAMFVVSFVSILLGTWALLPEPAWLASLGAAVVAAGMEAPVGRGVDNLTVPAAAGVVFWGLASLGA